MYGMGQVKEPRVNLGVKKELGEGRLGGSVS